LKTKQNMLFPSPPPCSSFSSSRSFQLNILTSLAVWILLASTATNASAFVVSSKNIVLPQTFVVTNPIKHAKQHRHSSDKTSKLSHYPFEPNPSSSFSSSTKLWSNNNNDNGDDDTVDTFDGKGFANYLAPYALALIASIGVTVAFVKYVLMDF